MTTRRLFRAALEVWMGEVWEQIEMPTTRRLFRAALENHGGLSPGQLNPYKRAINEWLLGRAE